MTLTDQMSQLADKIVVARTHRMEELAEIKPGNLRKMNENRNHRKTAMTELKQATKKDIDHIADEVMSVRNNTADLLHHYHEERLQHEKDCIVALQEGDAILKKQVCSQLTDYKADRQKAGSVWRKKTHA